MLKPVAYALMNVGSATTLILLNKTVFSVYGFHYTFALTAVSPSPTPAFFPPLAYPGQHHVLTAGHDFESSSALPS